MGNMSCMALLLVGLSMYACERLSPSDSSELDEP